MGALLRTPFEAMLAHNYAKLKDAGFGDLRPTHGAVLRHMAREGVRITELAEKARMTKQSMAELVDYMRERGYAQLVADPTDGRAKLVMLTERGWEVHAILVRSSRAFEKECARQLGAAKWQELRQLLDELAAWCEHYAMQAASQAVISNPASNRG